jgi:membrane-associated protease RseP (regulator of RpoE activity)
VAIAVRLVLVLVSLLFVLGGCGSPRRPALVRLTGIADGELREGDVLDLRGNAFPEGRPVEVTFRGEARRAGREKVLGLAITLSGTSASTHSVVVPVTREVERAFVGVEGDAHTTFRGSVEVSFRPRVLGTPPVTGELPEVVLDFHPAEGDRAQALERVERGERFASFAGMLLGDRDGRLVVEGVMPDSAAERAGLAGGDRLVELDGLSLMDVSDLVPPPRARASELWVERAGSTNRTRLLLDVSGFEPISPRDLAPVSGVILAIALFFLLRGSALGRALSFLDARLAERARARVFKETGRGEMALVHNIPKTELGL